MGAGGIGSALETYDPGRLVAVTIGVSIVTFVLSLLATLRNEPRGEEIQVSVDQARKVSFRQAITEVAFGDAQVRLFFLIIILTITGTLAQDVLLEPYGAQVLNMEVGDTTRLTAFWGLGVMTAMLLSGVVLIRYLGHMTVLRIGLVSTIGVFGGVVLAGANGSVDLFRGLVLVMGLGTGLAGAAMLTGIINFTTKVRAGLLMGLWGIAMVFGRAVGGLFGGAIVDITRAITGEAFPAYATVFLLEGVLLVAALVLTTRLHVEDAAVSREQSDIDYDAALGAAAAAGD
jgi:BCD family chlorophyll transporter-like MFS transporter